MYENDRKISRTTHTSIQDNKFTAAIHNLSNMGMNVRVRVEASKACETLQEAEDIMQQLHKIDPNPTITVKSKAWISLIPDRTI